MIDDPQSLEAARKLLYGPPYRISRFVEGRCAWSVWPANGGYGSRQCSNSSGHGKAALYCKQHAKKRPA